MLTNYDGDDHLNVGVGEDISISELAALVAEVVEWQGRIEYDTSMPDGMPRKFLDVSRIGSLGWQPSISLREGVRSTYAWFVDNVDHARGTEGDSVDGAAEEAPARRPDASRTPSRCCHSLLGSPTILHISTFGASPFLSRRAWPVSRVVRRRRAADGNRPCSRRPDRRDHRQDPIR